ncbi:MAG: response regulator [Patescibacteria group bacterium]|nr:response regulator [Patescibacteria group bacterium]
MMPEKIHILIADDDPAMRRIMGGRLVRRGFEIFYAADGNEAREMARRMQPDLILLDYRMPVMDGFKVASYLKKEELTKIIPLILLTNEDLPVEAVKYFKDLGVDEYIHKSADFEEFVELIKKVMKAHGRDIDALVLPPKSPSVAPM